MNRALSATLASVLLTLVHAEMARAGAFNIPNYSFESPATPYVSINIDSWEKAPKPDWYPENGPFLWTQLTGIFKNTPNGSSDHIDNCEGNQALWLFAVPDVGLYQDYDSIDWHNQPPSHQLCTAACCRFNFRCSACTTTRHISIPNG